MFESSLLLAPIIQYDLINIEVLIINLKFELRVMHYRHKIMRNNHMTSSPPTSHFISLLGIKVHYNLAIPNQSIINNNHVGYPINGFEYFLFGFAHGPVPTVPSMVSSRTRRALSIPRDFTPHLSFFIEPSLKKMLITFQHATYTYSSVSNRNLKQRIF